MKKAVIIDYGVGNLGSVQKALNHLAISNILSNDKTEIEKAHYIILPGVGSFEKGMQNLIQLDLKDFLTDQVLNKKKPFLGICLGMQLLASQGTEPVLTEGLNWIKGTVQKIPSQKSLRIPHMGWNNISLHKTNYFENLTGTDFYFVHSYHFCVEEPDVISSTTFYGIEMVSSLQKENIFATQFHPEKSQKAGLAILNNFFSINA